jgi:hypothetical protein
MITQNDINNMVAAANLAGFQVQNNQIHLQTWNAGINTHIPEAMPTGKQAVYIFEIQNQYLKVVRSGGNSQAAYRSHHYGIHRGGVSGLAWLLHNDPNFNTPPNNIDIWIRSNINRYNILFNENLDVDFATFVKNYFVNLCNPLY